MPDVPSLRGGSVLAGLEQTDQGVGDLVGRFERSGVTRSLDFDEDGLARMVRGEVRLAERNDLIFRTMDDENRTMEGC